MDYTVHGILPGQNAGVGSLSLLQGIFSIQGLNPSFLHCRRKYIMRNAGLGEAQAGIKTARRNIRNLRYADDTTLMAESEEEELKSLLMKVKEESEEVGLKLSIQKTKIMTSSPITSWQIEGETVQTVADFTFGGSKITADDDCSHEIKRRLLLGRKVMINLDSILKCKDKETQTLNDTIDQLDLIDIYRTFCPKTMNFTFFSSAHGTFSRIDHILSALVNSKHLKSFQASFVTTMQ